MARVDGTLGAGERHGLLVDGGDVVQQNGRMITVARLLLTSLAGLLALVLGTSVVAAYS